MQDVTRLRALEGELARTIQMMRTVKAARVHIVLADEGSFRRERQPSSASVVIRTDGGDDRRHGPSDPAPRRLGGSWNEARGCDPAATSTAACWPTARIWSRSRRTICSRSKRKCRSKSARKNVSRTLTPYLTGQNFQISVAARLNADKTQTNETIYNPDSRVERSVRVTKEQQSSQNAAGEQPAGVEANLPKPKTTGGESKQSNDQTQKREELTNYEVSSKSIQTTSAGFVVQNLSVAVLINRAALAASLGGKPWPTQSTPKSMRSSSSSPQPPGSIGNGATRSRSPSSISSIRATTSSRRRFLAGRILARQAGSILNAAAIVAVAGMMLWFGVWPGLRMAFAPPRIAAIEDARAHLAPRRPRWELRTESARRKHPHRDRLRSRRIHAGAARAARQWSRAQAAETDRFRRASRRYDPQTMDSSRSERMKPLSIADYLDRLGGEASERPRRGGRARRFAPEACRARRKGGPFEAGVRSRSERGRPAKRKVKVLRGARHGRQSRFC